MRRKKHNLGTREARAERHYRAALGEILESGVVEDVKRVLKGQLVEAFLSALDEADEEYGEAAELREQLAAFFGVDPRTPADGFLAMVRKLHADASGHAPQQDGRDDDRRLIAELVETLNAPPSELVDRCAALEAASDYREALAELVELDEDCTGDDLLSAVRQRVQALAEAAALVDQIEETLSATHGHVLARAKVYAQDRAAFEEVGELIFGEGADWSRGKLIDEVNGLLAERKQALGDNASLAGELGRMLGIPDDEQTHDTVVQMVASIDARYRELEELASQSPNLAGAREQC